MSIESTFSKCKMFWFFGKLRSRATEALRFIVMVPLLLGSMLLVWLFQVELDPPYDDGCMDAVKDQDDRGGVAR